MTAATPPPDSHDGSDDEVVSAYVDGEASLDERARVEGDPALLARVDRFRAVAAAMTAPPPPARRQRDTAVAAALAVAAPDREASSDAAVIGPAVPAAAVPALDERRRRRWRPDPSVLVAAVVAVLLAIGLGLVVTAGGAGDEAATGAGDARSTERAGADGTESGGASAAPGGGAPEGEQAATRDLGEFADDQALRQALVDRPATDLGTDPPTSGAPESSGDPASTTAPGLTDGTDPADNPAPGVDDRAARAFGPEAARCARVVEVVDPALGELLAVGTASIDGRPVWIFTHTDTSADDGRQELVVDTVTDRVSCQVRFAVAR